MQLPIVDQHGFHRVVDLVTMEAFLYTPDGDGRGRVGAIPHMLENDAKAAHEALIELVAEGKDELMEEFFAVGTIPKDHLISALHEAIREDRIFPVLYVSGFQLNPCQARKRAHGACREAKLNGKLLKSPDQLNRMIHITVRAIKNRSTEGRFKRG